ncbi:GL18799 [Drosophila persimilis]|uniref:GL18799 n=2 Tax=Drosophila persimilis TaxID=7234 RepID=B4G8N7_DROPE|nr:GL18799 [Drosophila persimilis]
MMDGRLLQNSNDDIEENENEDNAVFIKVVFQLGYPGALHTAVLHTAIESIDPSDIIMGIDMMGGRLCPRMRIAYCNVLPALLILQVTFILVKCTDISANLNINLDFSLQKFFTQADIEIDAKLKTVELIKKYKYPVETHFVITKDGYKLCMHRMPRPGAQPVLLVHGLMSSSASWVIMGPTNGLAYILFQKGYDVWMLNTRGNIYSKEHTKRGISDKDFYDFSFHEIGTIDLPSAIDLVLEKTKFQQIQYIGHSQGSTAFFVMCSEHPEYSVKVKIMQALSPTTFMEKTRSAVLKFMSFFKGALSTLLAKLGGHVISATSELIQKFQHLICPATELTSKICGTFDFVLCGFNWDTFNRTLTPIVIGHVSQGASTMQIHHYAQLHKELHFRRYDHGPTKNLIRYKSLTPPSYNLSQTQCKVVLHHGGNDWLASGSDVINLQKRLPNCIESRKVELESFTHFDFMISKDVTSLVYNRVIDLVVTN